MNFHLPGERGQRYREDLLVSRAEDAEGRRARACAGAVPIDGGDQAPDIDLVNRRLRSLQVRDYEVQPYRIGIGQLVRDREVDEHFLIGQRPQDVRRGIGKGETVAAPGVGSEIADRGLQRSWIAGEILGEWSTCHSPPS